MLVTVLSIVLLQPMRYPAIELLLPRWRISWDCCCAGSRCSAIARDCVCDGLLAALSHAGSGRLGARHSAAGDSRYAYAQRSGAPLGMPTPESTERRLRRLQRCEQTSRRALRASFCALHDRRRILRRPQSRSDCPHPRRFSMLGLARGPAGFVKRRGVDVIFIALPLRHIPRVHDVLDALATRPSRCTTCRTYSSPISCRRDARDPRRSGHRDARDAVPRISRRRQATDGRDDRELRRCSCWRPHCSPSPRPSRSRAPGPCCFDSVATGSKAARSSSTSSAP